MVTPSLLRVSSPSKLLTALAACAAGVLLAGCGGGGSAAPDASPAAQPPPQTAAPAAPAPIVFKPGMQLAEAEGVAAGDILIRPCDVVLPSAAQVLLELPEPLTGMTVEAEGEALTLMVRNGRQKFCGKTDGNVVTVGRGAWGKGTYEVLVGTSEPGGRRSFKLRIRKVP